MKSVMASILQIAGVGAVAYGCWSLADWLGYIVGGAGLVVVGFAVDPPNRSGDK